MAHKTHQSSQLAAFKSLVPGDTREKIYPYDSSITVVSVNGAWGLPKVIVPVNTLNDDYPWTVGDVCPYHIIGLYVSASANQAIPAILQICRVVYTTETLLNATSGAGEAPADRIYVGSTAQFEVGDAVWIMDDSDQAHLDGEVGIIASIDTDNYLDLVDNLTLAYTVADSAKVYLVRRGGAGNDEYRAMWFKYSAASAKDTRRFDSSLVRVVDAGDGLIIRGYGEGGAPETDVNLIYDDDWL